MVPYRVLLRQIADRINAITGSTPAAIEAAYLTSPLTATQVASSEFTLSAIKDALISSIGQLIAAYAAVPNHPFRTNNTAQTANIAHRGVIPSTDATAKKIVGTYGAIRDATTFDILTEHPLQEIERIRALMTAGSLLGSYFYFKQIGERLAHTRTNVILDVCVFDRTTEEAAIAANGNAPIPDALETAAWCGTVALLVKDDQWANQAGLYGNYFNQTVDALRNGATSFASMPTAINSQAPAVS